MGVDDTKPTTEPLKFVVSIYKTTVFYIGVKVLGV